MAHNESIKILDIYLDSENPRHNPISDQQTIIEMLLKKEKVKRLARDIAENGLSPLENFAVLKGEQGHYIVIEGNRRLCALMLLLDPDKSPSNSPYFRKLAQASVLIPSEINCTVFKSREESDKWIERKHQGEQDGIGTKNWDTKAKERHFGRKKKGSKNSLAITLLEYAETQGLIDPEQDKKIVTTAQRYLDNPYFRKTMGITSSRSDSNVTINTSFQEFNGALKVFIDDLVAGVKVTSRSKGDDWENYARELIKDGVAPRPTQTTRKLSDATENTEIVPSSTGAIEPTKNRHNKNPEDLKHLISSDFTVHIKNKILKKVFDELRKLEVDVFTLATSMVTRAFLEQVYELYYEKMTGKQRGQDKVHIFLVKVLKLLETENLTKPERNALAALKKIQSTAANVLSPLSLGANAHAGYYPNSRELKREFHNIEAILKFMISRL